MATKLQHEIKKRTPFDSLEQEATLNLIRTSDQLQIRFARLFREHSLTPSQFNILRILRGEGKPLPILEIASRTVTVVPGITGLVDRLEEAGLVRRERCKDDRRIVRVALAPMAEKLLDQLEQPVLSLHTQLLNHLNESELNTLIKLLEKVRTPLLESASAAQ